MIDWTQPIETTETPPRPVRVLFDEEGAVAAVRVGEYILSLGSPHLQTLRNVAPPPKKTAEEAVANVAKGPVKTCETCRWFNIGYHPDACKRCSIRGEGLQLNWEAKND